MWRKWKDYDRNLTRLVVDVGFCVLRWKLDTNPSGLRVDL